MTRVELLVVICAGLVAAYLVVRYQKTGEVFQISWRKTTAKTNSVAQPIRPVETRFVDGAKPLELQTEMDTTITNPVVVKTNVIGKPMGETPGVEIKGKKLDEWQKRKVLVPTNAIWSAKARKKPGVRIAFP